MFSEIESPSRLVATEKFDESWRPKPLQMDGNA
jgi:hypothetical protein